MIQSPATTSPDPAFADVLVPRHLRRAFTYRVPAPLRRQLAVGSRVLVPFGPSTIQGVVIALAATPPPSFSKPAAVARLKEIIALADDAEASVAPPDLLELSRLVAEQYLAPWGQPSGRRIDIHKTFGDGTRAAHASGGNAQTQGSDVDHAPTRAGRAGRAPTDGPEASRMGAGKHGGRR
nr:hypothetical protein [Nitrospirota bacterium]